MKELLIIAKLYYYLEIKKQDKLTIATIFRRL